MRNFSTCFVVKKNDTMKPISTKRGAGVLKSGGGYHNSNREWFSSAFLALGRFSIFSFFQCLENSSKRDEICFMNERELSKVVGFQMDFSICVNVAFVALECSWTEESGSWKSPNHAECNKLLGRFSDSQMMVEIDFQDFNESKDVRGVTLKFYNFWTNKKSTFSKGSRFLMKIVQNGQKIKWKQFWSGTSADRNCTSRRFKLWPWKHFSRGY